MTQPDTSMGEDGAVTRSLIESPQRIQRKRSKGWRMPENTVYVGRGTKWGNPYKVGAIDTVTGRTIDAEFAVRMFRLMWLQTAFSDLLMPWTEELRGKNLACWCKIGEPCHADLLLEIANAQHNPSANTVV